MAGTTILDGHGLSKIFGSKENLTFVQERIIFLDFQMDKVINVHCKKEK